MSELKGQGRSVWITKEDISNLKDELQVGDYVQVVTEREKNVDGKLVVKKRRSKEIVIAKYPHQVEVTTRGPKRVTVTYKDILLNELERMRRTNEGCMG